MILFSASFICWFITLDIFAFWNVPLGNILSKPEIICHQNFHQNIILPWPSLTVLTLDVVRGVWRRWRRKVPGVSAPGQELARLLGCPETPDEFLPFLSPVRLFRRGPGLNLQQKPRESWTNVGTIKVSTLFLLLLLLFFPWYCAASVPPTRALVASNGFLFFDFVFLQILTWVWILSSAKFLLQLLHWTSPTFGANFVGLLFSLIFNLLILSTEKRLDFKGDFET